jgi:hypothetical protein
MAKKTLRKNVTVKPRKGWALVSPHGTIDLLTVNEKRDDLLISVGSDYEKGFVVRRVLVTVI